MTRRRPLWGAWVIAIAMLCVACSDGPDRAASGAVPAPEARTDPENHDQTRQDENQQLQELTADHETSRPSTTEDTLAAIRAMHPARLAGLHGHHDRHDRHDPDGEHTDPEAARHPNGIDPARVVIPTIGVDADVIDLGVQPDGTMEVPTDFSQAGWFAPGPRPGRVGPSVIAGHVDSRSGPAVFFRLTELEVGDEIEVHSADGETVTFAVRETEQHPKDAFPTDRVYAGTPGPELRLITCGGAFDTDERSYRDNIIVYAERIDL